MTINYRKITLILFFIFIVYMVWKEQKASLCIQINKKNLLRPKDPKEQGSHLYGLVVLWNIS